MKYSKLILGVAAIGTVLGVNAASAADMAVKARPMVADAALDWSGFYVGVNGGYGWQERTRDIGLTNTGLTVLTPGMRANGGFGGGQVGYNWQRDVAVFGVEADFQGADIRDSFSRTVDPAGDFVAASRKIDYFGTVRGRLGFLVNNTLLLYGTGGFAYGEVKTNYLVTNPNLPGVSANLVDSSVRVGYAAGAGAEYAFNRSWSVKAEYQFIYLGSDALRAPVVGGPGVIVSSRPSNEFHTVRVGINYHLNQPIVAKF
jgi:outer membrane immunogenic protein